VINLNLRTLHKVFINNPSVVPTSANVTSYNIPNPGCNNGDFRPFAVKYYRNKVYVGVVCSNETAQNTTGLAATVYEFDPSTGVFTVVLQFPLTFRKGKTDDSNDGTEVLHYWKAWSDNPSVSIKYVGEPSYMFYPQFILSDIEFDVDGTMILSGMDRYGHQLGWFNYYPDPSHTDTELYKTTANSQVFRAGKCSPSSTTWTIENNASVCGNTATGGAGNNRGPGGGIFYYQNTFQNAHEELSFGGIAVLAGSGETVETALDPINYLTGGFKHLKNVTGGIGTSYELYATDYAGGNTAFGKANGLGDLKLLCDAAPLEIGNRVWSDNNSNGLQDAGEPGIDGITVKLFEGATEVGSFTTSNGGLYYFTNSNVTGGVKFKTAYEIRIALAQSPISTLSLSQADAVVTDLIDNDGLTSGTNAIKSFITGNAGENNHSYDFGFMPMPSCEITAVNLTTACNDAGTTYTSKDDFFNITINPSATACSATYTVTTKQKSQVLNFGPFNYGTATVLPQNFLIRYGDVKVTITDADGVTSFMVDAPETCASIEDPHGYFYCETTGEIIPGGSIAVTPPAGGTVIGLQDGSTGEYQFKMVGNGVYSIAVNPPAGMTLSTTHLPSSGAGAGGAFDPSAGSPDNLDSAKYVFLGSPANAGNLLDFAVAANPYYLTFDWTNGDPDVFLNNFPLTGCDIACAIISGNPSTTCADNGTPGNPADDTFTVSLNPTGTALGTAYAVTDGVTTWGPFSYGVATTLPTSFLILAGDLSLVITDEDNISCVLNNVLIAAPATCSIPCTAPCLTGTIQKN
jgi:SdrD B-like domain